MIYKTGLRVKMKSIPSKASDNFTPIRAARLLLNRSREQGTAILFMEIQWALSPHSYLNNCNRMPNLTNVFYVSAPTDGFDVCALIPHVPVVFELIELL